MHFSLNLSSAMAAGLCTSCSLHIQIITFSVGVSALQSHLGMWRFSATLSHKIR